MIDVIGNLISEVDQRRIALKGHNERNNPSERLRLPIEIPKSVERVYLLKPRVEHWLGRLLVVAFA